MTALQPLEKDIVLVLRASPEKSMLFDEITEQFLRSPDIYQIVRALKELEKKGLVTLSQVIRHGRTNCLLTLVEQP